MSSIITRFAPSPTGYLHIGSARTALFNWLFARHHGGIYHLRIEDTDRERSTQQAVDAILQGLTWLNLPWDGEVVYQFSRAQRHKEIAQDMVLRGHAYYCTCSPEAVEAMREKCRAQGIPPRYDGTCRTKELGPGTASKPAAIRLKMPQEGHSTLQDLVQGSVTVAHGQLDDFILLRTNGTPTYLLSVVVDDHDMKITHVIRGDDHLTNTFRQWAIYRAMEWHLPEFAHIPLIHGPDGAKLSKRHGALGVDAYEAMGYLPEALCNYLCRLGWSHGDDELFSREQAISWFNLESIGKAPARFDFTKLGALNGHYIRHKSDHDLVQLLEQKHPFDASYKERLLKGMTGLKQRAKTLLELQDHSTIYQDLLPSHFEDKARELLTPEALDILAGLPGALDAIEQWEETVLESTLRHYADTLSIKFGILAQPLRAALTGRAISPGVFDVMAALGKEWTLARIQNVIK